MGDARGKRYGNICICITDSLCYKAETNTIVKQLYSNKDVRKKNAFELRLFVCEMLNNANVFSSVTSRASNVGGFT